MSRAATYVVVGGGISGLVATYRIRAAAGPDATVLLFDPADRLGGVLRTETLCGEPIDPGEKHVCVRGNGRKHLFTLDGV